MIITALWGLLSSVINWVIQEAFTLLGSPPSWWPTGGFGAFQQGIGYFTYFFDFPALIAMVVFSMAMEFAYLSIRGVWRTVSVFTGGGGSH